MSSAPQPNPWHPEPPDDIAERPAEGSYVSEFLSEKSPEFEAVRQAAAAAREEAPTPVGTAAAAPVTPTARPGIVVPTPVPWKWLIAFASVAAAMGVAAWIVFYRSAGPLAPGTAVAAEGTATIISRPAGADVYIDGVRRGLTPLRLTLPVGSYAVELRNGSATRSLTLAVDADTAVREAVDLVPGGRTGRLEVASDVAGARVSVDGVAKGVTPLVLSDVEPGVHRIAITRGDATVYRTVTVEAGATASVVAAVVPSGATGGWLTFRVPFDMQVLENGQVLGTTSANRLMVPAGRHELVLVAAPYGFSTATTVVVGPGRTQAVTVDVPSGQLSINALPWANVWLDGQPIGATPLANIDVPVGDHDVIWRHPELGERRESVRVTVDTPARVGVDFTSR